MAAGMTGPRIGILGAAKIAPGALIEPARATGVATAFAVAARDPERARAYAETHGIPVVADSYEALIARPDVDVIYNALPPARHADLSIAALQAGKPVLCEKPFAMSAGQASAMVETGRRTGLLLMEAFHYRYHPLFQRVMELVQGGEIGRVTGLDAVFNVPIPESTTELRHDPALGGGALMDLGTYCLHWCRSVAGTEPKVTSTRAVFSGRGVDLETEAHLDFDGLPARIACSMQPGGFAASLRIEGSAGSMTVINPLAPQLGHRLTIETAGGSRDDTFTREPTYNFQLRAFVAALDSGTAPLTSGDDSIGQMTAIDAIYAAAGRPAPAV